MNVILYTVRGAQQRPALSDAAVFAAVASNARKGFAAACESLRLRDRAHIGAFLAKLFIGARERTDCCEIQVAARNALAMVIVTSATRRRAADLINRFQPAG